MGDSKVVTARKKVLVTGGAGYIGAHTAVALHESGFQPVLVDNFSKSDRTLLHGLSRLMGTSPQFYEGDCKDKHFLKKVFEKEIDITAVMHFAAYKSVAESVEKPVMYYHNNINSLLSLLEAMQEHGVMYFVFSSSCTVYGEPERIPVDERAPFRKAASPYGATKQMGETILEDATRANKNLQVVSLRYFNPIGAHPSTLIGELPLDRPDNLVPYITQTAVGKRKKLVIFGNDYDTPDGTCIRDFIHVVDLAHAHVAAVQKLIAREINEPFDAFNLGTGEGVSVLQLVKEFISATGADLPYEMGPRRPGDVVRTFAQADKAQKALGWQTKYSLREALQHAWAWEKKISNLEK